MLQQLDSARFYSLLGGALVLLAAGALGCSSRHHEQSESVAALDVPVPQCVEYENFVRQCFHRDLAIADHPSLIPKTREEHDKIATLCQDNLARVRLACR